MHDCLQISFPVLSLPDPASNLDGVSYEYHRHLFREFQRLTDNRYSDKNATTGYANPVEIDRS